MIKLKLNFYIRKILPFFSWFIWPLHSSLFRISEQFIDIIRLWNKFLIFDLKTHFSSILTFLKSLLNESVSRFFLSYSPKTKVNRMGNLSSWTQGPWITRFLAVRQFVVKVHKKQVLTCKNTNIWMGKVGGAQLEKWRKDWPPTLRALNDRGYWESAA